MKVIAVAAFPRSGTTFMGKYIGNYYEAFYAGEVFEGVKMILRKNSKPGCSCGARYDRCPVWSQVQTYLLRKGIYTEKEFLDSFRGSFVSEFFDLLSAASGFRTIIDTSKNLRYLKLLKKFLAEEAIFVHVLRNPKGVINSRIKGRKALLNKGVHKNPGIEKYHFLISLYDSFKWVKDNLIIQFALVENRASKTYIYERLFSLSNPELSNLIRGMKLVSGGSEFNHIVMGHRNRFQSGQSPRLDSSWETELSRMDRVLIDLVAWPFWNYWYGKYSKRN